MAKVKVLVKGYTNADSIAESGEEKNCATITLILDEGLVIVVDPGVLKSQQILIDALNEEKLSINDVSLVCITHSHIDHYRNIGMFPNAKVLEFFGLWDKNKVENWKEQFSRNIQILKTPGHDYTGITLFVTTDEGIIAICGDVFWKENYPKNSSDDIYASDYIKLEESRRMVLEMADWIIPGHADIYKVDKNKILKDRLEIKEKTKTETNFIICKKCKKVIEKPEDACLCRPYLCYRCCECDINCDLCSCKRKHKKYYKSWKKIFYRFYS